MYNVLLCRWNLQADSFVGRIVKVIFDFKRLVSYFEIDFGGLFVLILL